MGENSEKVSFEWEFDQIDDSLRKLNFIKDGFRDLDPEDADMYSDMIEGVLPGIITNLEGGYSELRKKLVQNP